MTQTDKYSVRVSHSETVVRLYRFNHPSRSTSVSKTLWNLELNSSLTFISPCKEFLVAYHPWLPPNWTQHGPMESLTPCPSSSHMSYVSPKIWYATSFCQASLNDDRLGACWKHRTDPKLIGNGKVQGSPHGFVMNEMLALQTWKCFGVLWLMGKAIPTMGYCTSFWSILASSSSQLGLPTSTSTVSCCSPEDRVPSFSRSPATGPTGRQKLVMLWRLWSVWKDENIGVKMRCSKSWSQSWWKTETLKHIGQFNKFNHGEGSQSFQC